MTQYTSLELSKDLQDVGFEKDHQKHYEIIDGVLRFEHSANGASLMVQARSETYECYPAYDILNDLCVKYADEVWENPQVNTQATPQEITFGCNRYRT